MARNSISIWFFIGLLLAVYGALILAAGVAYWNRPGGVVLADLHVAVWWGALLLVIGSVYSYLFAPSRKP